LRSAAHPRGLCGDRACERCRAIRAKAVAARDQKAPPPPWPLPGPITSLDDVLTLCTWAAQHLAPPRANAIDRLCKTWLKAHDFATRIRALEAERAKLSTERK